MTQSPPDHYNIEKFRWETDDIISYLAKKNDLRRKNGVIQYSIFEYLHKKQYYVGCFHYPDFSTYRKHVQENIELYPETKEAIQAQEYIEFNLTKHHRVIFQTVESELYSILRIYVTDYKQFEKVILKKFPNIIRDSIVTYTIFTNHYNDNIVLLFLNWADESSFDKYLKSYEIQKQILLDLSVNDLDNDLLMKKNYSWKA